MIKKLLQEANTEFEYSIGNIAPAGEKGYSANDVHDFIEKAISKNIAQYKAWLIKNFNDPIEETINSYKHGQEANEAKLQELTALQTKIAEYETKIKEYEPQISEYNNLKLEKDSEAYLKHISGKVVAGAEKDVLSLIDKTKIDLSRPETIDAQLQEIVSAKPYFKANTTFDGGKTNPQKQEIVGDIRTQIDPRTDVSGVNLHPSGLVF